MNNKQTLALIWSGASILLLLINLWPRPSNATEQQATLDGVAVFQAKGCLSCHSFDPLGTSIVSIGPNLSTYQGEPEFLRSWLGNPEAERPGTLMPNLQLSETEIEALVELLSTK